MKKKQKIKRNFFHYLLWLTIIFLLFFTRFFNLNWGLPFPMHPDERNMAVSLIGLTCSKSTFFVSQFFLFLKGCFNPHFYAYGQFPSYLGYLITKIFSFFLREVKEIYSQAVLSLRFISATVSILNFFVLIKLIEIFKIDKEKKIFYSLIFIFTPFFIQFSHFGTTESLLMFFYSLIVLWCLRLMKNKEYLNVLNIIFLSLISGLSIATKVSSLIFLWPPLFTFIYIRRRKFFSGIAIFLIYSIFTLLIAFIFSPHNLINFNEFISSIKYERDVALGSIKVFYTTQFLFSKPIIYQFFKIYPFALGFIGFILFLVGFFFTQWKKIQYLFLKLSFLIYFLPTSFLFVKWTRFQAPVMPLALVFIVLILDRFKNKLILSLLIFLIIIPGIAYLSVYQGKDVRIEASEWMSENLADGSVIVSETANVVDVPYVTQKPSSKNFNLISFNFYNLDDDFRLQIDLSNYLKKANYIIIPSRRIIYNYTCWRNKDDWVYFSERCPYLKKNYPLIEKYYQEIVFNKDRYRLIKTFTDYPQITLFGKKLVEIPDEAAEETWSVFDHPVIRLYQRLEKYN